MLLVACSGGFFAATWWINPLCFWLSPVALVLVFFYSLTKRFTAFSHFFLGFALSVSPVGAWLAVTGSFALPALVLTLGVLFQRGLFAGLEVTPKLLFRTSLGFNLRQGEFSGFNPITPENSEATWCETSRAGSCRRRS